MKTGSDFLGFRRMLPGVLGLALAMPVAADAGLLGKCQAACSTRASFECDSWVAGSRNFRKCAKGLARGCRKEARKVPKSAREGKIQDVCAHVDLRDEWRFSEDTLGGFSADVDLTYQSGSAVGGFIGDGIRWSGAIVGDGWAGASETELIGGCLTNVQFTVESFSSTSDARLTVAFECEDIAGEETYHGTMYRRFFE